MAVKLSGFSFIHNALEGGYPIVEATQAVRDWVDDITIVDMVSTDRTPEILRKLGVTVLQSDWLPGQGRESLHRAFSLHHRCRGDVIIFFEADEIFDDRLLEAIRWQIERGRKDLGVWRLQIEQNFQRVRWYPTPVHRVFPNGAGSYLEHPTHCPDHAHILGPGSGFLWDCCNCFKKDWFGRKRGQAEIWGQPRSLMVPEHFTQPVEIPKEEEDHWLNEAHWLWTETPLNIPAVLKPLVGLRSYADSQSCRILLGDL